VRKMWLFIAALYALPCSAQISGGLPPLQTITPISVTPSPVEVDQKFAVLIRSTQIELIRLGHDVGGVDGVYGPLTANAISQRQRRYSDPIDGQPSEQLLIKLKRDQVVIQQVNTSNNLTPCVGDDRTCQGQRKVQDTATATSGSGGLKPGLQWPIKGTVMVRFGADRSEGGVWRGILLRAATGTTVHSVASGTVVYANWLRGFGNLLIIDHGQQFLSVYGYNQSLLKQIGDEVKTGDTVALAGSTGGQTDSALYFEIRHRGQPVDPIQFLAR
jgi:murein DD-endopeptidase MepM/ murein hydrolase activator NlpD